MKQPTHARVIANTPDGPPRRFASRPARERSGHPRRERRMNRWKTLSGRLVQRLPVKLAMVLLCSTGVCGVGAALARGDPASGSPQVDTHGFIEVTEAIGLHYGVGSDGDDTPLLDGLGYENGGLAFGDVDNDGHADLFVTNGWFDESLHASAGRASDPGEFAADPSRLFMSNGDGTFTERAAALGIDHAGQGRGVVCTDYDVDGRVDIFIANLGGAPSVYRNNH